MTINFLTFEWKWIAINCKYWHHIIPSIRNPPIQSDYAINKQLVVLYRQPIDKKEQQTKKWRNSHSANFLSLDKTALAFISSLKMKKKVDGWKYLKRNKECIWMSQTWLEGSSRKQIHVDCTKKIV